MFRSICLTANLEAVLQNECILSIRPINNYGQSGSNVSCYHRDNLYFMLSNDVADDDSKKLMRASMMMSTRQ